MKSFFDKCSERSKRLIDVALHTNQTFETLRLVQELQAEKNDIVNISPAFFQNVKRNCIEVLFIEIAKMYSHDRESEGIRALLCDMNMHLGQLKMGKSIQINWFSSFTDTTPDVRQYDNLKVMVEDLGDVINNQQDIIDNIMKQRNKYYAHLDKKAANSQDFFEKNKVTYHNLQDLLLLNMNITNAVYMYFHNSTVMPLCSNYDDVKSIIWYAERGVEERRKNHDQL